MDFINNVLFIFIRKYWRKWVEYPLLHKKYGLKKYNFHPMYWFGWYHYHK